METFLTSTILTSVTSAIKDIYKNDTLFGAELLDSVKNEKIIYNTPLNWQPLARDLNMSVYHLCQETILNDDQEITDIQGIVYIDIMKKIKQKDLEIIFDEIDKVAWTAILCLDNSPPDLNTEIRYWTLRKKHLYVPNQQNEDDLKNNILKYVCEISLNVFYSIERQEYFGLS